ncbi:hypothetical protein ABIB25_003190 [Nakamurella sp. UYEF19]|uniref:hypothetical protein n=1 Tax=Nakamurella sp. UYEF19 TaxID=1756392 RepID=UPI003397AD7E
MDVKFRGGHAYIGGHLLDDEVLPLMRLKYGGYAASWGFAIYLASKTDTNPRPSPTDKWPAYPKTPWTAPAASTSATPRRGPEPPTNSRT